MYSIETNNRRLIWNNIGRKIPTDSYHIPNNSVRLSPMKNLQVEAEKTNLLSNFDIFRVERSDKLSPLRIPNVAKQWKTRSSPFLYHLHREELASLINFSIVGADCKVSRGYIANLSAGSSSGLVNKTVYSAGASSVMKIKEIRGVLRGYNEVRNGIVNAVDRE